MTHDEYQLYLLSPHWRETREKRLQIDKHKCAFCGALGPLHVHHLTYQHLGQEDVWQDLITLCSDCHHKLHEMIETEKPYVNKLYDEWEEEANGALKIIADKYIDKEADHLVKITTPFILRNGWKNKPTILSVIKESMDYKAGKQLGKNYPWYNSGSRSPYLIAMPKLPKRKEVK